MFADVDTLDMVATLDVATVTRRGTLLEHLHLPPASLEPALWATYGVLRADGLTPLDAYTATLLTVASAPTQEPAGGGPPNRGTSWPRVRIIAESAAGRWTVLDLDADVAGMCHRLERLLHPGPRYVDDTPAT